MKKIPFIALTCLILSGCSDNKVQKKAILDSILSVHDKVMSADEQLMKNKMLLDTLIKQNSFKATDTAVIIREKLIAADSAMENWMHGFDYEQKGKSNDETIGYFKTQKRKIMAIDSQINMAVTESNAYLIKFKKK